jgi:cyclopropane fatty-acyl-phospholipid synthase-like methyltransferase
MQYFLRAGDTVLDASSDWGLLSAYAVHRANGSLTLMVINKDSTTPLTANFALTNFVPGAAATLYSYGMPRDNAAKF